MLMFQARQCTTVTDSGVSCDMAQLAEMHKNSHECASQFTC